jgi:ABC-type multidrug transport system permease subunit
MRRFYWLLQSEFKSFLTAPVVHLIAILQPTLMYLLMSVIMVVPIFEMHIGYEDSSLVNGFILAAEEVRSPIGPDYIDPILVDDPSPGHRQVVEIVTIEGQPTALQRFGQIDSNLVKNHRNRLTAALLKFWETDLGSQAVIIQEYPWLPLDIPYTVFFGMAMIPLAAYLAAAMIGGYLMAREFEGGTILIYKLSPVPFGWILAAKIVRLVITALVAGGVLYLSLGLITGVWSASVVAVFAILFPLALIAACIGMIAGMITHSPLPSFLVALVTAFAFWLVGSGFGLAAGFSRTFELISRLIPNTLIVEMLFPYFYFGRQVEAHPTVARLQLAGYVLALLILLVLVYQKRILSKER